MALFAPDKDLLDLWGPAVEVGETCRLGFVAHAAVSWWCGFVDLWPKSPSRGCDLCGFVPRAVVLDLWIFDLAGTNPCPGQNISPHMFQCPCHHATLGRFIVFNITAKGRVCTQRAIFLSGDA